MASATRRSRIPNFSKRATREGLRRAGELALKLALGQSENAVLRDFRTVTGEQALKVAREMQAEHEERRGFDRGGCAGRAGTVKIV